MRPLAAHMLGRANFGTCHVEVHASPTPLTAVSAPVTRDMARPHACAVGAGALELAALAAKSWRAAHVVRALSEWFSDRAVHADE